MAFRPTKRLKYGNKKIVNQFGVFDSIHEYEVYLLLLDKRAKGQITELHRQVPFELIPAAKETVEIVKHLKKGDKVIQKERVIEYACDYIADFTYMENGAMVVVDAKSEITRKNTEYVIKRKLMLFRHGIRIKEM